MVSLGPRVLVPLVRQVEGLNLEAPQYVLGALEMVGWRNLGWLKDFLCYCPRVRANMCQVKRSFGVESFPASLSPTALAAAGASASPFGGGAGGAVGQYVMFHFLLPLNFPLEKEQLKVLQMVCQGLLRN